MTDFETDIPEQIEDLLNDLLDVRRDLSGLWAVQKHHIDIAKGIELTSAISTQGNQCQRHPRYLLTTCRGRGRSENVSQQDIDKIGPARADFMATAASLVFQAQPMLFDLQEFLVKR
jgi:hypothetical protein